ncbi:MAG: ferritin-like domain-containing protein [Myxococcota bacterium]
MDGNPKQPTTAAQVHPSNPSTSTTIEALDEATRERIASDWWFRHHAELEAKERFEQLVQALTAAGAVAPVVQMAHQAVQDEERHAERCRDVAVHYRPTDPFAGATPDASSVAPPEWSPQHSTLYETVALCCVAETINAALLTEVLSVATEPLIRSAVRAILRDEIQHARLGWAYLASLPHEAFPQPLSTRLPALFEDSISEALIAGKTPSAGFACHPHGFLSRSHRLAIFCQSLTTVIFPGLARYPIDLQPAQAWFEAQPWRS